MTRIRCLHDAKAICGESPVWVAEEGALYWSDIPGLRFHRHDLASGRNESWAVPEEICSFAPCEGGGFIAALRRGFAWIDPAAGLVRHLGGPRITGDTMRFNDGRCDRSGRHFFAGTMNLPRTDRTGTLFRLASDGSQSRVAGDVLVSNGLAFTPDNRGLYWSDSRSAIVWRFDFDPMTGQAGNQRVFVTPKPEQGRPDGAAVDAEGCYWSACWNGGRLVRWRPDGSVEREIAMPVTNCTMVAFGGPDLRTIFVTSAHDGLDAAQRDREPLAGGLFVLDAPTPGLPEAQFRPDPRILENPEPWR